uniref:(northern house mosquito) hypothetical protein n=1 Tax=Culex pipiens TaxID=7175 RepID=A0A8D8L1E9_CULPI
MKRPIIKVTVRSFGQRATKFGSESLAKLTSVDLKFLRLGRLASAKLKPSSAWFATLLARIPSVSSLVNVDRNAGIALQPASDSGRANLKLFRFGRLRAIS